MSFADYVVISVLLVVISCIVLFLRKRKQRGGSCASCPNQGLCSDCEFLHPEAEKKPNEESEKQKDI